MISKESSANDQDVVRVYIIVLNFMIYFFMQTHPAKPAPVKLSSIVHQSSKVVEYMKSLERRSPRKSPLAKYHKLRKRSPCKFQRNSPKGKIGVSASQSNSGAVSTCLISNKTRE